MVAETEAVEINRSGLQEEEEASSNEDTDKVALVEERNDKEPIRTRRMRPRKRTQ